MIPSLREYPVYFWQLLRGIRSGYEARFAEFRNEDTRKYLEHVQSPEILDLGNGRLRPQFTILKHAGYRVYGIDLANQPRNSTKNFLYVSRGISITEDHPFRAAPVRVHWCAEMSRDCHSKMRVLI